MDSEFLADEEGLRHALSLLCQPSSPLTPAGFATHWPDQGLGAKATLDLLAPHVLGGATPLGSPTSLAHMDPPTPWITWATTQWNAALNQNLLHPALAPVARRVEEQVVQWLAPHFGMSGGHMTPGSTLANLTAIWAARECAGIDEVLASDSAHLSIAKAAHILGLGFRSIPTDDLGALRADQLPHDLSRAALVLTAGTTTTGAIDPLSLMGRAAWTHVDAAWAGALRLTQHADRLAGVEQADSVALSAHKWLFQPKESALVFFRDPTRAHAAISFGGAYLAVPNVGVLGSHGATAVPLLATLLAWGREGLAARIERCVAMAEAFAQFVREDGRLVLLAQPRAGVVIWRPVDPGTFESVHQRLPVGAVSTTTWGGTFWFRTVAANPNADLQLLLGHVANALDAA